MAEESFYVSMKVKDFDEPPVPSVKRLCSGGCGDMVFVDNRLEYVWSNVPIVCLECALELMDKSNDEFKAIILPESIESLMEHHLEKRKSLGD